MHAHRSMPKPTRPYPWEQVDRGTHPDMDYLLSEGARARYVLAAHYVRDQEQVVEIGGFKTPITAFLTHVPERVLVVDPLVTEFHGEELNGRPCRVDHVAKTFQQYPFELDAGSYGLVLLGASMKYFSRDSLQRQVEWDKLVEIVRHSAVAVLEFALEWRLGRDNIDTIVREAEFETVMQADLDLRHSPGMDTIHHQRRMIVVRPPGRG